MTESDQLGDMLLAHMKDEHGVPMDDGDLPGQMLDIMDAVAKFVGACAAERWRNADEHRAACNARMAAQAGEQTGGQMAGGTCMWIRGDGTRCGAAATSLSPIGTPHCGQHGGDDGPWHD